MSDLEIQKIIKDKSKEIVDEVSQLTPVCAKWRSGAEKTLTYPFDKVESDKWLYEITAGNPVPIEWVALKDERVKHSHSRKQDTTFYEFDYEKSRQEMKPIIDAMDRRTMALFRELLDEHQGEL